MKDPIQWHARDALSTAVPAVAEEMHPHEAGPRPEGHEAYAVFDELPTETENVRFLGLVSPVVAKRFHFEFLQTCYPNTGWRRSLTTPRLTESLNDFIAIRPRLCLFWHMTRGFSES